MTGRSPYVDRHGLVRRCCRCGAFRNHDEPARWDFLATAPDEVLGPVSHGLCEPCFVREHGALADAPRPRSPRRPK